MLSRRTLLVSTVAGAFTPLPSLIRFGGPQLGKPEVLILHTNDIHGRFLLPGQSGVPDKVAKGAHQGLSYLATEIHKTRAAHPELFLFDAGDIIHGTPMEQRIGPAPILHAMNSLKYDCATAGNHEFDFGPENLRNASRIADFPILSANVRTAEGDPWGPLRPYKILDRGGVRVGVFGLTTTFTPSIQWPRTIREIEFQDPIPHAQKMVAELRPKVDLLICLSHLGYTADQKLAPEIPGVDLIIGGHSHTRLEEAHVVAGIPIVQTGALGKALGRLELNRDGKLASRTKWKVDYRLIDAAPISTPLQRTEDAYGSDFGRVNKELSEILGRIANPISDQGWESAPTPSGIFLAEAVRDLKGAEVGFYSTSQYGGTIPAGDVRLADLYEHLPAYTRQHIVVVSAPAELARQELARVNKEKVTVQTSDLPASGRVKVAAAAHVIQDTLYNRLGVEVLYDDPLGQNVRDAVAASIRKGRSPKAS